jgi:lysophospholipase L1-like esterase
MAESQITIPNPRLSEPECGGDKNSRQTLSRAAAGLFSMLLAVAVSLAIGEAALRAVVTLPLVRKDPEIRYQPHAVRRFTLQPSQVGFTYGAPAEVTELGFRSNGSTLPPAAPQTTVFALGDSFTFGLGVRDSETWPAHVEAHLRSSRGPSIRVINAGTISYGVFQELDLLREKGLPLSPSVVVHGLYWNDYMSASAPRPGEPAPLTPEGYFSWDRPPDGRGALERSASWLLSRSAMAFALRQTAATLGRRAADTGYGLAYSTMTERGLSDDHWKTIEAFSRDLTTLGDAAGFEVLVVIMPVVDIVGRADAAEHPYPAEARRRLAAAGIPFVDGFRIWGDKGLGRRHFLRQGADAHLDAAGYALLGQATASAMLADPAIAAHLTTHPD